MEVQEFETEVELMSEHQRPADHQLEVDCNWSSSSSITFNVGDSDFVSDNKAEKQQQGRQQMHKHQTMGDCYILDEADFEGVDDDGDDDITPLPNREGE